MLKIEITLCGGEMPQKAMSGAAGYDVKAKEDTILHIGNTVIPLGFTIKPPYQYRATIMPKAGHLLNGMVAYMTWDKEGQYPCLVKAEVKPTLLDYGHRECGQEAKAVIGFLGRVLQKGMADEDLKKQSQWDGSYYIRKGETVAQLIISEEPDVVLSTESDIVINHNR